MSLWGEFWADQQGALISAELVAVGTVAVIGTTVGLSAMSKSVNSELKELAVSIRSLNQSYSVPGHASCRAWTAGSSYTQPDVNQSIHDLLGDSVEAGKKKSETKTEGIKKKRKSEVQKRDRQDNDDQDQAALPETVLPQSDENSAIIEETIEEVDDESQVETVIEPATDA